MKNSRLLMWGERGIVASFFADMHLWGQERDWGAFLSSIDIDSPTFPRTADEVTAIIEPDYGNKGFGHPDVVLAVQQRGERFVLIVEAKRKPYCLSCGKARGQEGYNSTLKGQLELNYILSLSLSSFATSRILCEPEWINETPYAVGRSQGFCATLKNLVVLKHLVTPISGLAPERYFHLVLTTDDANPLATTGNAALLPELYTATNRRSNCWPEIKSQFGWLNYTRICAVADQLDRSALLACDGLFKSSFGVNSGNLYRGVSCSPTQSRSKNTLLVYIPDLNRRTFLHCSYQGSTCKLRDYSGKSGSEVIDIRLTTDEVLSMARIKIRARRVPISNFNFWHDEIQRLNAEHLPQVPAG